MAITHLRQQDGAVVVTIPSDVAAVTGWSIGIELYVKASGDGVIIKPAADDLNSHPVGKEVI
ncbi:AbrB/MazE/SpoVT family DNA-binding domain-containing protein [Photorhabdus aegyptia]|uniref:AbrB family transcriptional regulator n=1 Tax=Photorhabdus aegyptia TaxID=2805098 RepID=A0A022PJI4_9GAMM|nr:AbrB/MazE/SpoVT family DNA-binding domain-containing protein [Photorhabdus aegyptia]EYU16282.1 hypothetical protein BA1DRAFT_01106 [Photorhabdus aegyptia]